MASLRDTVKDYQEELRDGIAWVAFWKTGRSWNAEYFHLEMSDILYPEDRSRMEEIKQADPAAVVVNGYYSGYLGEDRNLDELTAGVRRHYENGYSNIGEFIEAHDDRLPPELIEEARAAAHAAGLPFSEKAYRDGEEPDPYLFDGSMSMARELVKTYPFLSDDKAQMFKPEREALEAAPAAVLLSMRERKTTIAATKNVSLPCGKMTVSLKNEK